MGCGVVACAAFGNMMLNRRNFTPLWAEINFRTTAQMHSIVPNTIMRSLTNMTENKTIILVVAYHI